ncbi:DUF2851 family protein [Aureisphaera galaxeae]|uniref:DUF2851 family protein n=1 Tax=Aureisphaera galaxeae TaxID=1538023 RepID=UPI00234FDB37|nr:DUF2851 family protein [Aureisphaera galaxeae]MDC8004481.1 DUF2851 family protein [Aureisphaera galaxeae]
MHEDFLHYVWKFQKYSSQELTTYAGEVLQILSVGTHNFDAGPDFLVAKLKIGPQLWIGNVEIHLSSSHWYQHGHEQDAHYDNVVLHVVWDHDTEVYRNNGDAVPVLELKERVCPKLMNNYSRLLKNPQRWIPCEPDFGAVEEVLMRNWMDRLFFERLEVRAALIEKELALSANHWEKVFFQMLCKSFGLKINGASFYSLAQSMDYDIVRKCSDAPVTLEALFMGQLHLLEGEVYCGYYEQLQDMYTYLKVKHNLGNEGVVTPKFFRLRPPNFPTIRLSQMASLLSRHPHLFSQLMETHSLEEMRALFAVSATHYWDGHYNFGVPSAIRKKSLSNRFIDLLIINTVIPLKYCYAKYYGKEISEELISLACAIRAEENSIVKKYKSLRNIEDNALQSQALLQLKSNYCDLHKCLQCEVGNTLLKKQ